MQFGTSNQNQNQQTPQATSTEPLMGVVINPAEEPTVDLVKQTHDTAVVQVQNSLASSRDLVKAEIIRTGEAQKISDQLSVTSPQSIVEYGKPLAEQMSKVADEVLRHTNAASMTDPSRLMGTLAKIMDQVDIDEIKDSIDEQPSFFGKLLNNAQKKLDKFMAKYKNVGDDIEKVCIELRTYEAQIQGSNNDLANLYNNGIESYKELMKYVIAGEIAMGELDNYTAQVQARATTDPTAQLELNTLIQAKQLLEQRIQDLRLAESVALQTLPTLKALEFGNLNLSRKIQSSFIITLPIFKNAVAQAVIIKQQALQAKAMSALDQKTNELLLRNSQNVADNMRATAALSGKSAIDIETIEKSWETIMNGIKDTKSINEELARQREQDKRKLEELNQRYLSQVN